MEEQPIKMKPIWYFVGLLLSSIGAVILISGIVDYFGGTIGNTVLAELHPQIWWGAIMMAVGLIFLLFNRKTTVE